MAGFLLIALRLIESSSRGMSGLISDGVTGGIGSAGMLAPAVPITVLVLLALIGLRDKTIFLAARSDQYFVMMIAFLFPFVDMIIALKLIMLAIWWGAATSKLNHHFPFVVAVMISNSPLVRNRNSITAGFGVSWIFAASSQRVVAED